MKKYLPNYKQYAMCWYRQYATRNINNLPSLFLTNVIIVVLYPFLFTLQYIYLIPRCLFVSMHCNATYVVTIAMSFVFSSSPCKWWAIILKSFGKIKQLNVQLLQWSFRPPVAALSALLLSEHHSTPVRKTDVATLPQITPNQRNKSRISYFTLTLLLPVQRTS